MIRLQAAVRAFLTNVGTVDVFEPERNESIREDEQVELQKQLSLPRAVGVGIPTIPGEAFASVVDHLFRDEASGSGR